MIQASFLVPNELRKEIDAFKTKYDTAEVKITYITMPINLISDKKRTSGSFVINRMKNTTRIQFSKEWLLGGTTIHSRNKKWKYRLDINFHFLIFNLNSEERKPHVKMTIDDDLCLDLEQLSKICCNVPCKEYDDVLKWVSFT